MDRYAIHLKERVGSGEINHTEVGIYIIYGSDTLHVHLRLRRLKGCVYVKTVYLGPCLVVE